MICEYAIKKDGEIICMCQNLARGTIEGNPSRTASSKCLENTNCYYKEWRRAVTGKKEQ